MNRNSKQLEINELIHQIIYLVKHKNDYKAASHIMTNNYISIDDLEERTIKITEIELAKLADALIENKIKIN